MSRLIDMSGPVVNGAEWFGAPCEPVQVRDIGSIEREGWLSHVIHLTTISGTTYIETGGHLNANGATLDEVGLDRLVLRAHVWRCAVVDGEIMPPRDVAIPGDLRGKALVVICGWYDHWNSDDFFSGSPFLSAELQDIILARQPAILGGDSVAFDNPMDVGMPFLRRIFEYGGIIVSPLFPDQELTEREGRLIVAPLKLEGVNSSPCRVYLECS